MADRYIIEEDSKGVEWIKDTKENKSLCDSTQVCFCFDKYWLPTMNATYIDGQVDALKYILDWVEYHVSMGDAMRYTDIYLAGLESIKIHAQAALERLNNGGIMESTTTLD